MPPERRSLVVLQPEHEPEILAVRLIPRRGVLLLGAVAAGFLACRADADIVLDGDGIDDTGGSTDDDAVAIDETVPVDDTGAIDDAGSTDMADVTNPPMDAVSGTDVQPLPDVQQPRDVQQPPDVQQTCTPVGTSVGAVTRFAQGTWTKLSTPKVIVGHDASGMYAFSSVCTHQGCVVDAPDSTGSTYCACHGSIFDGNGAVVQGPATRALPHYRVTICNATVYISTSMTVSASTRTPV